MVGGLARLILLLSTKHTLDGWLVGLLVGWLVGWLVGRLVGWLVRWFAWFGLVYSATCNPHLSGQHEGSTLSHKSHKFKNKS